MNHRVVVCFEQEVMASTYMSDTTATARSKGLQAYSLFLADADCNESSEA